MNERPIIGIVGKHYDCGNNHACTYGNQSVFTGDATVAAVRQNSGDPFGIYPPDDGVHLMRDDGTFVNSLGRSYRLSKTAINNMVGDLRRCDGLIFQGGDTKDIYEFAMARLAYKMDIPTLGICAGYQTMGQAHGGKLAKLQHQKDHFQPYAPYAHLAHTVSGTKLRKIVGGETMQVNSKHRYGLITIPHGFKCAATDGERQCEAIEAEGKTFYIGTQWHPELLQEDPLQENIFKAFITAAADHPARYR